MPRQKVSFADLPDLTDHEKVQLILSAHYACKEVHKRFTRELRLAGVQEAERKATDILVLLMQGSSDPVTTDQRGP